MLVVEQGQVAVIKAYVGLPTQDTSGVGFKFGSLVRPGHQGIWQEALRTGKYPINPRIYDAKVVLTAILKLDWAKDVTGAHGLDARLEPIIAKSNEGFVFSIDLQVLIHVPDTKAPRVISMVGSMENLVNEVLQAAVGNLFRDKIGGMEAIKFIQTRQVVQEEAFVYIQRKLAEYEIETRGVYIQDVIYPAALVTVLTEREVAHQQVETFKMQRQAQDQRIETEKARGTADMQAQLAQAAVGVDIKKNNAEARKAEADGESTYIERTGTAQGAQVRAVGLARAEAYQKQVAALGQGATALVNAIEALSRSNVPFMPNTLVTGGGGSQRRSRRPGSAADAKGVSGSRSETTAFNPPSPGTGMLDPASLEAGATRLLRYVNAQAVSRRARQAAATGLARVPWQKRSGPPACPRPRSFRSGWECSSPRIECYPD
jgi:hypothetical protein